MRYYWGIFLFFFATLSFGLNITLVNPTNKEETFWALITELMQKSALDLNVNLTVYYSDSHRIVQSELIEKIVTAKNKPDYVVFLPYGGSIIRSFNALEKAKIPFVTLERAFDINKVSEIALPQEVYKYWLGEIYNDNVEAGKLLSSSLYHFAKENLPKEKTHHAIAINGDYYAESLDRAEGFSHFYKSKNDVIINQILPARWSREEAGRLFLKLHHRYEKNEIVWAASDQMALGVLDVIEQTGLMPNKDFFLGGFDLIPEAIKAIEDNRMTASVGGHFLQGAWALIKIYDHHHNVPNVFKKGDSTPFIKPSVIDRYNIDQYKVLADRKNLSKVDFSKFSVHHNSLNDDKQYQLTLESFIEKLNVSLQIQ
jgi:ABC-type sugar transport system substrate-binding protein